MAQNKSHAVMAQRAEPHDSLDFFPTPPWATRAFCEWLKARDEIGRRTCWEPACGDGAMARPLREYFAQVAASDIRDYGFANALTDDFLLPNPATDAEWIVTNPPFRLGEQFISLALERADVGVAMLVRTAFLESADRYEKLFRVRAPSDILQFVERVPMFKGRLDRHGSTATAYCWLVWRKAQRGFGLSPSATLFHWIEPCRKRLERDSDYPPKESA